MVVWLSKDQTLQLGVVRLALSTNVPLIRRSTEQGLAAEVGGTITDSSTATKNGHDIWTMSAHGHVGGKNIHVTQSIVRYGDGVYKAMAVATGETRIDLAIMDRFVNSLEIKSPNVSSEPADKNAGVSFFDRIGAHSLSKEIGGASVLLLVVLIVCLVLRRRLSVS